MAGDDCATVAGSVKIPGGGIRAFGVAAVWRSVGRARNSHEFRYSVASQKHGDRDRSGAGPERAVATQTAIDGHPASRKQPAPASCGRRRRGGLLQGCVAKLRGALPGKPLRLLRRGACASDGPGRRLSATDANWLQCLRAGRRRLAGRRRRRPQPAKNCDRRPRRRRIASLPGSEGRTLHTVKERGTPNIAGTACEVRHRRVNPSAPRDRRPARRRLLCAPGRDHRRNSWRRSAPTGTRCAATQAAGHRRPTPHAGSCGDREP